MSMTQIAFLRKANIPKMNKFKTLSKNWVRLQYIKWAYRPKRT